MGRVKLTFLRYQMFYPDDQIKELLDDPVTIRTVKIIDRTSLSILELLEYGIPQKEINHALAIGVIVFDKTPEKSTNEYKSVAGGDYYYNFLNSRVKLTDLGLLLLQQVQNKN